MDKFSELKAAAMAATQGDWHYSRSGFNSIVQASVTLPRGGSSRVVLCKLFRSEWRGELKTAHDAAFIAAANPAAVLALLAELEAKDKRIAEVEGSHKKLRETLAAVHNTITGGGAYTSLAGILTAVKRAYLESSDASACTVTVEGDE